MNKADIFLDFKWVLTQSKIIEKLEDKSSFGHKMDD
jgi:hypothetical protein